MKKHVNKYALSIFGFTAILIFNAAIFAQPRDEVWIVADRRADCRGVAPMKCLQVKKPQDEMWMLFYQNIENFRYEDGYTYVLRVKVDRVKNAPADASNLKYALKKILHRERTGGTVADENGAARPALGSAELNGIVWQLTAIDGVATDRATFSFDFVKKSVGGNGGCNAFGGNLSGKLGAIKISEIFSTKMFCEDISDTENKYLAKLKQVTNYRIVGGKLQMLNGESVVLEFVEKK